MLKEAVEGGSKGAAEGLVKEREGEFIKKSSLKDVMTIIEMQAMAHLLMALSIQKIWRSAMMLAMLQVKWVMLR